MYCTVNNRNLQPGILRKIITTTGRILLFVLMALLTFISVLMNILNPFYYKKVFKNINEKASNLMNAFFPVISEDDITDNMGGYFGLVIMLAGMVILFLSLKSC